MKKAKVMLSCIYAVAIVASALAFKAKAPNTCAYTRTLAGGPAVTTCPSVAVGAFLTELAGDNSKYATTIPQPASSCPATTTCGRNLITVVEQ